LSEQVIEGGVQGEADAVGGAGLLGDSVQQAGTEAIAPMGFCDNEVVDIAEAASDQVSCMR
jgi:hypothetical protein